MVELRAGDVVAGKYRLEKALSDGGMGSVWRAQHLQLEAPVAIKFMHGRLLESSEALARFEREAKASAQIRSPYVVHVYDHGVDDGIPYIVMEYLEGEDLGRRIKREPPLSPEELVRICEQVAKGLSRAHKLGIIHRDLKPGNVFLSAADDDMVKILDFGIAKETGEDRKVKGEVTTVGQILGSPQYMSPEQARGQEIDGRSDLWALAVILYRALTRERPFDADDMGDLIVRICTEEVPPPSTHRPDLGPAVDAFFAAAFQRRPAHRFQSARDFATAFHAAFAPTHDLPALRDSGTWTALRDSGHFAAYGAAEPSAPDSSRTPDLVTPSVGTVPSGSLSALAAPSSLPHSAATPSGASAAAPMRRRQWLVATIAGGSALVVVGALVGVAVLGGDGESHAEASPPSTAAPEPELSSSSAAGAPTAAPVLPASASLPASATATASSSAPSASASSSSAPRRRPPSSVDVLGY